MLYRHFYEHRTLGLHDIHLCVHGAGGGGVHVHIELVRGHIWVCLDALESCKAPFFNSGHCMGITDDLAML